MSKVESKQNLLNGYFCSYEEIQKNVMICTDGTGTVISVENIGKVDTYNVFYRDELMTGLEPNSRLSFGSLLIKAEDLKLALKTASVNYQDDDSDEEEFEYENCND